MWHERPESHSLTSYNLACIRTRHCQAHSLLQHEVCSTQYAAGQAYCDAVAASSNGRAPKDLNKYPLCHGRPWKSETEEQCINALGIICCSDFLAPISGYVS
ncbi:hypothetical protein BST61_g4133 [Cercospora zeina]